MIDGYGVIITNRSIDQFSQSSLHTIAFIDPNRRLCSSYSAFLNALTLSLNSSFSLIGSRSTARWNTSG
jgi:hypothetical protein